MAWCRIGSLPCCVAAAALIAFCGCGSSGEGGKPGSGGAPSGGTGGTAGDASAEGNPVCGDGLLEGDEECDNGPKNAKGSGCEPDCKTSCHAASDCDDGETCDGPEACADVAVGRSCVPGTPPAEGSACTGGYCKAGACTKPICGDGNVELGEGCDPPGATCSPDCQVMVCGDGKIVGTEECDDGNTKNLDGCDAKCRYETMVGVTQFVLQTGTAPSFCADKTNAFANAFASEIAQGFSKSVQDAIDGGSFGLMLALGALDDLSGTNDPGVDLGLLSGALDAKDPKPWTPGSVDAWYLADQDMLDATGLPLEKINPASITARLLSAGPATTKVRIVSGTTVSLFESRHTSLRATIADNPPPDVPAPPPTQLAAGLSVLRAMKAASAEEGMCGALTVGSLSKVVMPQDFALGGNACLGPPTCSGTPTYTYCGPGQPVGPGCNSILDVLVGGCKMTALCLPAVKPTQPDVGTGSNPPAVLSPGANNKVTPGVETDAYSFYMRFLATRAHVTNNLP